MHTMATKFGVDSSSLFPSRARHTDRQTDTQSNRCHWSPYHSAMSSMG